MKDGLDIECKSNNVDCGDISLQVYGSGHIKICEEGKFGYLYVGNLTEVLASYYVGRGYIFLIDKGGWVITLKRHGDKFKPLRPMFRLTSKSPKFIKQLELGTYIAIVDHNHVVNVFNNKLEHIFRTPRLKYNIPRISYTYYQLKVYQRGHALVLYKLNNRTELVRIILGFFLYFKVDLNGFDLVFDYMVNLYERYD